MRFLGFGFVLRACGLLWIQAGALIRGELREGTVEFPIHIFTLQKDEGGLILDWFNYHSNLIGNPGNMHIIDHNSTDPDTVHILADIRRRGGEVIDYRGMYKQASIYTEIMRRHTAEPAFLVPLDADEFMVGVKDGKIIIDPTQVLQFFSDLPVDGFRYKFQAMLGIACDPNIRRNISIPISQRAMSVMADDTQSARMWKTFYYSREFVSIVEGNHGGRVGVDANCSRHSPLFSSIVQACQHQNLHLGIIHFGSTHSFIEHDRKMARGAVARGHNISTESPEKCPQGSGRHYCKYIGGKNKHGIKRMKADYEVRFNDWCSRNTTLNFTDLSEFLSSLSRTAD